LSIMGRGKASLEDRMEDLGLLELGASPVILALLAYVKRGGQICCL
jgi:hypothetical protein